MMRQSPERKRRATAVEAVVGEEVACECVPPGFFPAVVVVEEVQRRGAALVQGMAGARAMARYDAGRAWARRC